MERLGKSLQFKEMEDWYKLTKEIIHKNNGQVLLGKYGGSLSMLVRSVYPEHIWELDRFSTLPKGYRNDSKHRKVAFTIKESVYLNRLGAKKELKQFIVRNGGTLFNKYRGSPVTVSLSRASLGTRSIFHCTKSTLE